MADRPVTSVRPLHPVHPLEFYERLQACLGRAPKNRLTPREVVSRPFPEISSLTRLSSFRDEYLLQQVLRKYPAFDLGVDRRAAALESFRDDEKRNRETNQRLLNSDPGLTPRVRRAFDVACRKAVGILGRFDPREFVARVRFGPGSTTSRTRCEASTADKLSTTSHVTHRASGLATLVLDEYPLWNEVLDLYSVPILEHEYGEVLCVPKNALTDRIIEKGPDLNVAMQLGVGACIRARLYEAGIDLNDQSINQRRAFLSSLSAEKHGMSTRNATLDLKSASNSVTTSFVWRLLGNHSRDHADLRWYELLDALRVEYYMLDGEIHEWQLFSAMGNGATFELESLAFYCLAAAACEILGIPADVSVYGDDLIVPIDVVEFLIELFDYAGFRLNQEKSFWSELPSAPRFRESCGKHYLDGMDVTPFYVKDSLNTVDNIVLAANNLVRWAMTPYGRDRRVLPLYLWLVSHLPYSVRRCRIPFGPENDGLISDFDEAVPQLARLPVCNTPTGWKVKCLTARTYSSFCWVGMLLYVVDRMEKSQRAFKPPKVLAPYGEWESVPLRDPSEGDSVVQLSTRVVTEWPWIGPWVSASSVHHMEWLDYELSIWLLESARKANLL